jgi:hypothetical protein
MPITDYVRSAGLYDLEHSQYAVCLITEEMQAAIMKSLTTFWGSILLYCRILASDQPDVAGHGGPVL